MGRNATWTNEDGLVVGFGARTVEGGKQSVINNVGNTNEAVLHVTVTDIDDPTVDHSGDTSYPLIPAGSHIDFVSIYSTEAVADTAATFDIGLYNADGTAYDADGLADGITGAHINSGRRWKAQGEDTGSNAERGALLETATNIATLNDTRIGVVVASGSATAGVFKVVVGYSTTT